MSDSDSSKVLGAVVLARHGDRQGFYQSPTSYAPSGTAITPLGNLQEFQLGQYLRSLYANDSSPSYIQGFTTSLADQNQYHVRADAGGEGGVIFNSAISLTAGLFPETREYNTTLANGTTVIAPLNGYQTIPIESVEPGNDVSLEGWTSCGPFTNWANQFYNSEDFRKVEVDHKDFLNDLPQYLDGRPVSLKDMWNIYDFMNVQYIHDPKLKAALPDGYLEQARALANYHEHGVFSHPQLNGIGNIAGQTILPSILDGLTRISNSSDPLKFLYEAISYKPFISLFNMTGAAQDNPQLAGIVNYAAAVSFEVRDPGSGGEVTVRLNFKNGTDDSEFKTYTFFNGTKDVSLSTFKNYLAPSAINTTTQWCDICSNTADRGCDAIAAARTLGQSSAGRSHDKISPVGASFLGAGLSIAVIAMCLAVFFFLGVLTCARKSKRSSKTFDDDEKKA